VKKSWLQTEKGFHTIQATAVGMTWLSDLFAIVPNKDVLVKSVSGHKTAIITRHPTRANYKYNGDVIGYDKLWKLLTEEFTK
jgi:hypothetical protein